MRIFSKVFFIRCKVYIDRARMYIGYVQFVMLVLVFLNSFKSKFSRLFDAHPILFVSGGLAVFLVFSLFIGWFDYKLGFFAEEQKRHTEVNPIIKQLFDEIRQLNEKIK